MLQADKSVRVIAKAMGKTRDCIRKKITRLGLEVVEQRKKMRVLLLLVRFRTWNRPSKLNQLRAWFYFSFFSMRTWLLSAHIRY